MPTDACMFFHECCACHAVLRPRSGDCCVFCSYGSVACPPIQVGRRTGGNALGCCTPSSGPVKTPLHATPSAPARLRGRGVAALAHRAGVFGAVLATLCCAGTPFIVSGLAILGLSFLQQDAILWPLMLASVLMAVWGFWQGYLLHGARRPMSLGLVGGASPAAGVIVIHGFPAMQMIYGGAPALIVVTAWNLRLRRACTM
jgi:MerC mercury resistance protein